MKYEFVVVLIVSTDSRIQSVFSWPSEPGGESLAGLGGEPGGPDLTVLCFAGASVSSPTSCEYD